MKTLLFLLLPAALFAQATITLPGVAGESSLQVTVSATAVSNLTAFIQTAGPNSGWPNSAGTPAATTLTNAIADTTTTTITLASVTNLQLCNGLLIDSEVLGVVSCNAGTNQCTVVRGTVGSTKATHAATSSVTPLRFGNYTCFLKGVLADTIANVVSSKLQGALITAQTAAKATADASIAVIVAGSVQ